MKIKFSLLALLFMGTIIADDTEKPNSNHPIDLIDAYKNLELLNDNDGEFEPPLIEQKKVLGFSNDMDKETSAYHAIKNGALISSSILDKKASEQLDIDLIDKELAKKLFGSNDAIWKSFIIKNRAMNVAHKYICKELQQKAIKSNDTQSDNKLNLQIYLWSKYFVQKQAIEQKDGSLKYKLAKDKFVEDFISFLKTFNIERTKDEIAKKFDFEDIEFSAFDNEILTDKDRVNLPAGNWLEFEEILQLIGYDIEQKDSIINKELLFVQVTNIKDQLSNDNIMKAIHQLVHKKSTSCCIVFLFQEDQHWFTCVVNKEKNKRPVYILADPANQDLMQNKKVQNFIEIFEGYAEIFEQPKKQKVEYEADQKSEKEKNELDLSMYRSPLAGTKTEDLPTLDNIFNGKLPNKVKLVVDLLKEQQIDENNKEIITSDFKNCLLLHGPPGTGKTTIGELIARTSGREVVFASAANFINAYQGSGPQAIEKLFKAAKKIAKRSKKGVVVIIDEIEAAGSHMNNMHHTQEQVNTVKALLTTIDKYSSDPSIFVVCTTNYINKLEGALLSRFATIKVELSEFEARKQAIMFYLKKNNIDVVKNKSHESQEYFVFEDFINKLSYATKNFSGRDLKEVVTDALMFTKMKRKYPENYEPEQKQIEYNFGHYNTITGVLAEIISYAPFKTDGNAHALLLQQHLYSKFKDKQKEISAISDKEKKKKLSYALAIGGGAFAGFTQGSGFVSRIFDTFWPSSRPKVTHTIGGALAGTLIGGIAGGLGRWAVSE